MRYTKEKALKLFEEDWKSQCLYEKHHDNYETQSDAHLGFFADGQSKKVVPFFLGGQ